MENGGLQDMKLIIVSAMTRTKLVALVAAAICQLWKEAHPPEGGFRLSWGIAMWARLERGDKVGSLMETYMKQEPAANLHNTRYNQSDASFGFTAAGVETLLQSHAGEISLLPALPPQWPNGSVQGLRARGNFEVDISWRGGKLVEAAIRSLNGGSAKLRYGPVTREVKPRKGETYRWNGQ